MGSDLMFQVLYLTHLSKPSRIGWQLTLSTLQPLAEIAQLVEHATENRRVDSSSLSLGIIGHSGRPCGRSSAGRTPPCQGEGHEFESRRPLSFSWWLIDSYQPYCYGDVAKW